IVGEGERQRQLLVQPLRYSHFAQNIRRLVAGRRHLLLVVARDLRQHRQRNQSRTQRHYCSRASPVSPVCASTLHTAFFPCNPSTKLWVPHPFRCFSRKRCEKGGKPQLSFRPPFSVLYLC